MVQGRSHTTFYNIFLLPALNKIINESLLEIKEFNCQIIKTLSSPVAQKLDDSVWRSETPDRHNTLRFTRSKATKCKVCKRECSSKAQMKIHLETYHNGGLALAHKHRAGVATTRTAGLVQRQRSLAQYQSILSPEVPALGSHKVPATSSREVLALPSPEVLALPSPEDPAPALQEKLTTSLDTLGDEVPPLLGPLQSTRRLLSSCSLMLPASLPHTGTQVVSEHLIQAADLALGASSADSASKTVIQEVPPPPVPKMAASTPPHDTSFEPPVLPPINAPDFTSTPPTEPINRTNQIYFACEKCEFVAHIAAELLNHKQEVHRTQNRTE